ncbi:FKBP-type peptidyl-prolyl cis-trans isomerase [Timonella sp. A28]|uniref:FKBP-type peptidyl-prolyl cis-trans isomerase n=1 Tax=Timonella sp. A28 TaxID=3442640 RepID=UPI003EBC79AA
MKFRPLRGLTAVAVASALVLAGCSSDNKEDEKENPTPSQSSSQPSNADLTPTTPEDAKILEGVTFTAGKDGKAPTDIKVDADLTKLSTTAARVVVPGEGEEILNGDYLTANMSSVDKDGKITESTYDMKAPGTLINSGIQTVPQIVRALEGQKVGAWLTFGIPPQEADEATGAPASEGGLVIIEIVDTQRPWATGTDKKVDDASLPKVTLDEAHKPSIEIPKDYKGTDELQVVVLKEGDGATLTEESYLHAHYTGWQIDGSQFDSSWDSQTGLPTPFPLNGVIKGWTEGLSGQKLGSQVLLIIPGDMGYGEGTGFDEQNRPLGDLIFVVDLIATN